jgi:hypothetical protein
MTPTASLSQLIHDPDFRRGPPTRPHVHCVLTAQSRAHDSIECRTLVSGLEMSPRSSAHPMLLVDLPRDGRRLHSTPASQPPPRPPLDERDSSRGNISDRQHDIERRSTELKRPHTAVSCAIGADLMPRCEARHRIERDDCTKDGDQIGCCSASVTVSSLVNQSSSNLTCYGR